jgi:hypothetical protein
VLSRQTTAPPCPICIIKGWEQRRWRAELHGWSLFPSYSAGTASTESDASMMRCCIPPLVCCVTAQWSPRPLMACIGPSSSASTRPHRPPPQPQAAGSYLGWSRYVPSAPSQVLSLLLPSPSPPLLSPIFLSHYITNGYRYVVADESKSTRMGSTGYKVGARSRARCCLRAALPSPIQAC